MKVVSFVIVALISNALQSGNNHSSYVFKEENQTNETIVKLKNNSNYCKECGKDIRNSKIRCTLCTIRCAIKSLLSKKVSSHHYSKTEKSKTQKKKKHYFHGHLIHSSRW